MTPRDRRIDGDGPWLSVWAMIALIAAMCAPFLLATIPPLIDAPGHIAAAGIEAAPAGSALHRYYDWHWTLNLNLGGEIVMKLLGGGVAAGWWTSVIATAAFVGGCLSVIRTLNTRSAYGLGWAMIFALGFPWLWGFLNFLLAAGFAMLAFAASERLGDRPARRAMV